MKTKKKTIISNQIYKIEMKHYSDGSIILNRVNDGFNPIELLGVLELAQSEIIEQMKGRIIPDIINRKVIVRK